MIWPSIKVGYRHIVSSRKYAILNISGLTLGLTLTIMMVMLVHYELSFDNFHPNREKILKVLTHDLKSGEIKSNTPMPLSLTLINDFAEVKYAAGIYKVLHENAEVEYNNLTYSGFTGASVETSFFSIFNYPMLLGNKESALDGPYDIAVSRSFSEKIFGTENPVGKIVSFHNLPFTIRGMYADVPDNSEVKFDVLFSDKIRTIVWEKFPVAWWSGGMHTYVILQDGLAASQFDERLKEIPEKYFPDYLKGRETYLTTPFKGIHFNTNISGGLTPAVSPMYLFILSCIALVTLLIACINFINISTCQTAKRNRDTGIRKIVGAGRNQIIAMHLWNSLISTVLSAIIAIAICYLIIPFLENIIQRPIGNYLFHQTVLGIILLTVLMVSLVTGLLPGLYFSKISAIRALQFNAKKGAFGGMARNAFVVAQLAISILLIIGQFAIFRQISFMRHADLGFNNENLLAVHVNHIEEKNYNKKYRLANVYKDQLEMHGAQFGFGSGVITENIPGFYYQNSFTLAPVGGKIDEYLVTSTAVDENFLSVYEIDMADGRFFSGTIESDKEAFIINQTLMRQIGWDNIEGRYMRYHHEGKDFPVIGVIKDIHATSLKEAVGPMVFRYGQHNNSPGFVTFRLTPGLEKDAITFMEKTWNGMFPETPFISFDVKERYFQNYTEEARLSKIVGSFTLLAIILSMLGLIGLITFFAEQRTKEIGIRKVNGARISEVLIMLNKDFIKWVAIAFVIATPIAWYAMHKWLQNFAYKTELSWWIFALAGMMALGIALLTVSFQSWKAARRNPVESLRCE